jgi:hypothetical protein
MIPNQIYQEKVEKLVIELCKKYVNRKDIFEPLSKILPNYWNSIFLSAVKQIMFKRVYIIPAAYTEAKHIWVVKDPGRGSAQIANEIIQHEHVLRNHIWRKNGWGNPYREPKPETILFQYKDIDDQGNIYLIPFEKFRGKYFPVLAMRMEDEQAQILVRSIYKLIQNVMETFHDEGFYAGEKSRTDNVVDIYNNLELELANFKKLIDKL